MGERGPWRLETGGTLILGAGDVGRANKCQRLFARLGFGVELSWGYQSRFDRFFETEGNRIEANLGQGFEEKNAWYGVPGGQNNTTTPSPNSSTITHTSPDISLELRGVEILETSRLHFVSRFSSTRHPTSALQTLSNPQPAHRQSQAFHGQARYGIDRFSFFVWCQVLASTRYRQASQR